MGIFYHIIIHFSRDMYNIEKMCYSYMSKNDDLWRQCDIQKEGVTLTKEQAHVQVEASLHTFI